ncbi:MAG: response regulator [Mongoliibacter sp.]|uniref:LytR/AlgR family response regulator transcription factor n=1 Tax=Mongoliibacter sp. TaxID=2022438 RepID=UPI0012EF8EFE|nr:response regulator [Mongoliibacter sp.]TVP45545.1 MAG: response regulator [Mongoliibacter sp.]
MYTTIIIDDEPHAQDALEMLLTKYFGGNFEVVKKCSSVDEAVPFLQDEEPDLIFLDIQMPRQSGFALLELFENRTFDVIFTTAHKDYAIEAFKHNAFDYLLKPIDIQEFQKTIVRYCNFKEEEGSLVSKSRRLEISAFSTNGGLEFIQHDNIIYCMADKNYTKVFITDAVEPLFVSKSLSYIGGKLSREKFVRIHQSFLVSITKIKRFNRNSGTLEMINGHEIPVSTRKKSEIQKFA